MTARNGLSRDQFLIKLSILVTSARNGEDFSAESIQGFSEALYAIACELGCPDVIDDFSLLEQCDKNLIRKEFLK